MATTWKTNCWRTSCLIMAATIVLSLVAVSFEANFWSTWENENTVPGKRETLDSQDGGAQSMEADVTFEMPLPTKDDGEKKHEVGAKNDDRNGSEGLRTENARNPPEADAEGNSASNDKMSEDEHMTDSSDGTGEESVNEGFRSVRRERAKTFLMVFMGHSGSTALITELRSHSEFEILYNEPVDHGEYEHDTDLAIKRAREVMDSGIPKGKIPGFKIRPLHILQKPEVWREFVKEYDSRIIWQYRENIFKKAVGEYRHLYLNDTSVVQGLEMDQSPCEEGSDQKCRFRIDDMKFLHEQLNKVSRSDDMLAAAARTLRRSDETLIVRYEDYLYRRERTMKEIFDFLGVDFQDTTASTAKASPDSLCEVVINYQDLCDHFHPCPLWRPFLHDDANNCRCEPGHWSKFDSSFCTRKVWGATE